MNDYVRLPVGTAHADRPDAGVIIERREVQGKELVRVELDSNGERVWLPADCVEPS